jgi:RNA polymerase sigma-70 factor (ECF subfamily)
MTRWASDRLVSAAMAGEKLAVDSLISEIWPACYRLAASLVGDRSLAQDAAQEACVIVQLKVRGLRNASSFDAWMYRIVTREALRVRRRYAETTTAVYEQAFCVDTTEAMDIWRALGTLSPQLRAVTVLFYFDDLKTEEIAGILGVAHATVRTRLARARERLRSVLVDDIQAQADAKEVKQNAC